MARTRRASCGRDLGVELVGLGALSRQAHGVQRIDGRGVNGREVFPSEGV